MSMIINQGLSYSDLYSMVGILIYIYTEYLIGGIPTPLKNMSSSIGMMRFPTEWKVIKAMFQTTNQIYSYSNY